MADLLQNSSRSRFQTSIWIVKLGFLAIGIISTFLLLKFAIPYSLNLFVSALPRVWISFRSWLCPPYLYIVVNFIIISIAASSFQQQHSEKRIEDREEEEESENQKQLQQKKKKHRDSDSVSSSRQKMPSTSTTEEEIWSEISSLTVSGGNPAEFDEKISLPAREPVSEVWSDITCLTDPAQQPQSPAVGKSVKPLTENQRYVRKSVWPSQPETVTSGADDTLDDTWKSITEGSRSTPKRQLKKSDTWNGPRHVRPEPERELRKSETFNEGGSTGGGGPGLTREMSLSSDELNRRAEAFIQNFRLQRQKSFRQYMRTVRERERWVA